ncbi:MAG TPA: polysaccharide deacetylase family protein [Dissulfurispiraceae bacterium]
MGRAAVLTYHNVGIPRKDDEMRGLHVTPRMFRFQMWYLKAAGFRVVSLDEIVDIIEGADSGEKLVALTFDDGYVDFRENAYPVLKKHRYPATVFIVSDLAGQENIWDDSSRTARKRLLDWEGISELKDNGITFGAHSRRHPALTALSAEALEDEIAGSKALIAERLRCPVDFFCYPFGDYDKRVRDAVERGGYRAAFTTQRGCVHKNDNPFEIRRIPMKLQTHPLAFLHRLHCSRKDAAVRVG